MKKFANPKNCRTFVSGMRKQGSLDGIILLVISFSVINYVVSKSVRLRQADTLFLCPFRFCGLEVNCAALTARMRMERILGQRGKGMHRFPQFCCRVDSWMPPKADSASTRQIDFAIAAALGEKQMPLQIAVRAFLEVPSGIEPL